MKNRKLILTLSSAVATTTLLAPIATLVTSCSCSKENKLQFALIRTSEGYCIDSITNSNRSSITELVIPESIDGIPVVEISKGALKGCTNLKSITLPFIGRSKTAVGKAGLFGYIFGDEMWEGAGAYTWQCFTTSDIYDDKPNEYAHFAIPSSIKTVTITSASTISAGAFSNCKFIKNIYFKQESNSTTATEIGNYAFYNCMSLKTFSFPNTITTIGKDAFDGCTTLRKIELPSSITTIKHKAFANCSSAQSASIPSSVVNMGKLVFENFTSGLVMVEAEEVPDTWDSEWTTTDISVVYGYTSGGIYYVDKGVIAICGQGENQYAYMVSWQWSLTDTEITIPGTITCGSTAYPIKKVGANIFYDHVTLETINISENVEVLGANCFTNCLSLKTINFPSTLTTISSGCFSGCTSLETVDFNNVVTIGESAFEADTGLKSIDLGSKMETIGNNAFKNCTWLTPSRTTEANAEVQNPLLFPKTIKSIGDYAFYNIAKFRDSSTTLNKADIIFEEGNVNEVTIGASAFEDASVRSTTSAEYPNQIIMYVDFNNINIKKFNENTFKNVYIYGMYNFPQSVTEIGDYAFYNTTPVYMKSTHTDDDRELTLPNTVTSIGNYAFYNCYNCRFNLDSASNLEFIGTHAFQNCSYTPSSDVTKACFASLSIPNSVKTIGEYAFCGCSGMRYVILPTNDNFTRLENALFASCTNLGVDQTDSAPNPIVVPESVTYVGSSVFSGCKKVKYITIVGKITTLGSSCFAGCESIEHGKTTANGNLQSLVFSDEFKHLTSFGSNMYQGCTRLVWAPFPTAASSTAFKSITTIPSTCFSDCESLSNFEILSNITTIGTAAFRNCIGMTQVTGMESLKVINTNAFYGCTNLVKFELSDGCNSVGDNAFANCTSLGKTYDFIIPTNITQSWTTSTNKGMGSTPFIGWTSSQTIKIHKASLEDSEATGDLTTWWGWTLSKHGSGSDVYYTCSTCGSSAVHFVIID